MSDLTRRVLDADTRLTREDGTIPSDQWDDAVMELLDAAPILAQQVEAVEALADQLDRTADYEASQGDTWDAECIRSEAARIRDALNDAEIRTALKGDTP